MELTTALKEDGYTREEAALYLELIQDFIKQFQGQCPTIHDFLCIKAINDNDTALTDASNALLNAIAILNQSPAVKVFSLDLPNNWKNPKFKFGQLTKHGLVVGMYYNLSEPNCGDYEQWSYYVKDAKESRLVDEFKIELLSKEEMESKLRDEIKYYSQQINLLQEQLRQADRKG